MITRQYAHLPDVQISASCSSAGSSCPPSGSNDIAILPQHSVMPYETKNLQRNAAMAVATVAGGSGEPPQEIRRRLVRSVEASIGLLANMMTIVDAMLVTEIRSLSADAIHVMHQYCTVQ